MYVLSRARSHKLTIYSLITGNRLAHPDIEVGEIDKVVVYPQYKDMIALLSTTNAHIVKLEKSYKTYLVEQMPPALEGEDRTLSPFSVVAAVFI